MLCWLALTASAMGAEGCPNEASPGFRSYLPNCRGYEQVTPVFKGGAELGVNDVSEDGSHVLVKSLGVFAGSRSDTESHGSEYELSRSPSGWGVAAVSPPASSFPAQRLLAASPDLGETLWLARGPSESLEAANFYVREPDHEMVEIGPFLPPSATAGPPAGESEGFLYTSHLKFVEASADLSRVLFDLGNGRESGLSWPGDTTTEGHSLYEYSGRGSSHPELVGVNSEGHLISSCETYLGSPIEQDVYNAVSKDGGSVFFTAKACANHAGEPSVNEVYARLGVFPIDTVPVSEPSFSACEECQTGVASLKHPAVSEQPGEFAGASEDGSKVFFLTSQELFAGDTSESLYEYDFDNPAGQKIVRVSTGSVSPEVQGVARVSEDGSHVYFVARGLLTKGPREGQRGQCLTELTPTETTEEEEAKAQEEKEEPVEAGARCRPKQGGDNLYVFERDAEYPAGRVEFIATLSLTDTEDWGPKDERQVQATPDGRFVVFSSVGDLTAGDPSAVPQIFEYDAASEALVRVSRGAEDYEPQGSESANLHESAIPKQLYASEDVSPAGAETSLVVSGDGSTVMFESSAALTSGALSASKAAAQSTESGYWNMYEYHSTVGAGGSIGDGDVYLISDGVNRLHDGLIGLDPSSGDVFFQTADRLLPQDTDSQYDVYDARLDGGFAAPDPPAGCEGCEAAPLVQPLAAAPAGAAVAGSGGVVAAGVRVVPATGGVVGRRGGETPAGVRARALARALKACRKGKAGVARRGCEAVARRRYGPRRAVNAAKHAKKRGGGR